MSPREHRTAAVLGVLALSLVLSSLLAFEAGRSAAVRRRAAERVLRDYAGLAADEYVRRAQQGLAGNLYPVLSALGRALGGRPAGSGMPDSSTIASAASGAPLAARATHFFRLELPGERLALSPAAPPGLTRWIRDTLAWHADSILQPEWYLALVWGARPDQGVLVYAVRRNGAGAPEAATGYRLQPGDLTPILARVARRADLLPASLSGGDPVDSLTAVRVVGPADDTVAATPWAYPALYSATRSFDPAWGPFRVTVSLRPAAADRLVTGGVPRGGVPVAFGLLALNALLLLFAVILLRQEHRLAGLRRDFVAGVSHELRTPLAQLRMFAETLRLGRVRSDDEYRHTLDIMDREARRLSHLVENLLYFTRAERLDVRLTPEPTDLSAPVRDTVEAFGPLFDAGRVRVATQLEPVGARVDRGALRQIVVNLLDNAVKYGPPGQTVRVGLRRRDGWAELTVEDQGPGVPPGERERVWSRFYRLERDRGTPVAGTGIGLAVVRELVTLHGGRVGIEGADGGGARFVARFPLDGPEAAA